MPKKLKCYTRQGNSGQYTTCNKDIKENQPTKKEDKPKKKKTRSIGLKAPTGRIETGVLNKGKKIKAPEKKAPEKKGKVKKAVAKIEGKTIFSNVKTPLDITKSGKIKSEIKKLLDNNNTLKMPNKQQVGEGMKKAMLAVSPGRIGSEGLKRADEVIKKYNQLPKNIKDNLALYIYGYEKELHKHFSKLQVGYGSSGEQFYRYYNP